MQDRSTPRNIRRTWKVDLYGTWGDGPSATVYLGSHTVTLCADASGAKTAEIDGEAQDSLERAVGYLADRDNTVTLLSEERLPVSQPLPTPVIGKARACALHKIMGLTGLPHARHYALSAAALCEPWPLSTLADLTEGEARTVWGHLCHLYPKAREVAAQLKGRQTQAAA